MMRYGHQPLSEIRKMPVRTLLKLADGLMQLVAKENDAGQMENHG
jgi:hypothetical protein